MSFTIDFDSLMNGHIAMAGLFLDFHSAVRTVSLTDSGVEKPVVVVDFCDSAYS